MQAGGEESEGGEVGLQDDAGLNVLHGEEESEEAVGLDMILDGEDSEVMERLGRIMVNIEVRMEQGTTQEILEAAEDLVAICSAVDREEQEGQADDEQALEAQRAADAFDDVDGDNGVRLQTEELAAGSMVSFQVPSILESSREETRASTHRTSAWRRREILASSPKVASGLVKLLTSDDISAAVTACATIAGLCQNHVENASFLGKTPGLLEGVSYALCTRRDSPADDQQVGTAVNGNIHEVDGAEGVGDQASLGGGDGEEEFSELGSDAACQAYVHLAMQNCQNKVGIVRCHGVLQALRNLLLDSSHPDTQDTAAMVIANCADNFAAGGGEEAAHAIVSTPGLLSALRDLVCQSVGSFTDSADRSAGLAAVISLSDHVGAVHQLRKAGFVEALCYMLRSDGVGKEYDSMRAEALMALANVKDDVRTLEGRDNVLATVVHLSACAVLGRRGEGQAPIWAVRECLRPLIRLTENASNRACLARSDEALRVFIALLKRRTRQSTVDAEEEVALAVIALARLLECDIGVRKRGPAGRQNGGRSEHLSASDVLDIAGFQENECTRAQPIAAVETRRATLDDVVSMHMEDVPCGSGQRATDCAGAGAVQEPSSRRVLQNLLQARGVRAALQLIASHPSPPSSWQLTWARFASSGILGLDWKLSLHHHRHLAVCMGQHAKLGERSWLRGVDNAVLYMILEKTVSIPCTADSMLWVVLNDAAVRR